MLSLYLFNESNASFDSKKSLKFSIPAFLYFINNNLAIYIQLYMDPTSYQILVNLKIVSTALLYYLIMGKGISKLKWFSLMLLFLAGTFYVYGNLMNEAESKSNTQIFVTNKGFGNVLDLPFLTRKKT